MTSVTGITPFTYQWYTNGVPDANATATNYAVTNVQASTPTNFACVVTNSASANYIAAATNTWNIVGSPAAG